MILEINLSIKKNVLNVRKNYLNPKFTICLNVFVVKLFMIGMIISENILKKVGKRS
jgi:hypothetical protein